MAALSAGYDAGQGRCLGHQLIRRRKVVRLLGCFGVSVITCSSLVVVTQHAFTTNDIRQPVLQFMRRRRNRFRNVPNHHLDEYVDGNNYSAVKQGHYLHVGENTNTEGWYQLL